MLHSPMMEPEAPASAGHIGADFLRWLDPLGAHNLAAFDPESGYSHSRTFPPGTLDEVAAWVDERAGKFNIYYTANEVRSDLGPRRSSKETIAAVRMVYADKDPATGNDLDAMRRDVLAELQHHPLTASGRIVDSGGGYQLVVPLAEKLPATSGNAAWAESFGRGLAVALGADRVQNIDRLLRLPGPDNIPNASKRAKGRVRRAAAVVQEPSRPRPSRDEIAVHVSPIMEWESAGGQEGEAKAIQEAIEDLHRHGYRDADKFGDLPEALREQFQRDYAEHPKLAALWEKAEHGGEDKSGSGSRMALAGRLKRFGYYSLEDYASLAWIWDHAVQGKDAREDKLGERALARAWVRARVPQELDAETFFDPLTALDEPATPVTNTPEQAASTGGGAAGLGESWAEPFDIFGDAVPAQLSAPPAGSLPDVIERWARSESRRKGVSMAFASAAALAAVAGAIGNSLRIRPRLKDRTWSEPCCLWLALVDNPGSGKSPIISAALEPLRELDAQRYRALKAEVERWQTESRKKKVSAGPCPVIPRTLVDAFTMEKMVSLLSENPRGLLVKPDELTQTFGDLGAYKQNAGGDRAQFLRLYDGSDITVDRIGSGTRRADRALASIVAGTQPEKIGKLVRDLGADGMLQRFIFVLGDEVDYGGGVDEEPDEAAADEYRALLRYLAAADTTGGEPVALSKEAYSVLQDTGRDIRALARYPGAPSAWAGHCEKWGKILFRITLAFHAIKHWEASGKVETDWPVSAPTARQAAEFSRFLLRHQLTFYERFFEPDPRASEARGFAGYLLTHPELQSVKRRDVYLARKQLRERPLLLSTMGELEAAAWVRVASRDAEGPAEWSINPDIHSRFSERATWERAERKRRRAQIAEAGAARKGWLLADEVQGTSEHEQLEAFG